MASLRPALLALAFLLFCLPPALAQTYRFAQLQGDPINTTGWNLAGNANIGATPANPNPSGREELILTEPINNTSGAAFFNTPINISSCQRWVAEFNYRIFDGTGADGLAFCFLANPPTGFVRGGGVGIPANPQGLMIVLDPYSNANCYQNPELQIRWSDGTRNYEECPFPLQPTKGNVAAVRQPTYNHMKIAYNNGNIEVSINGVLELTGFYNINYAGYFGFTASTGGSTDRHSVKDFVMYTYKPIMSAPNAGSDKTACSDMSVQLGVTPPANDPYTYRWYPTTGLDNPYVANPTLTLTNPSATRTFSYFVTKDSAGGPDSLCAFADEVKVTILGKGAQAGADFSICSGEEGIFNVASRSGYSYEWSPSTGLLEPYRSNSRILINNSTGVEQVYTYILKATNANLNCIDYDTINVTVLPKVADAGPGVTLCPGEQVLIGTPGLPGYVYSWSPSTNLTNPNSAQTFITSSVNQNTFPLNYTYTLRASKIGYTCNDVSNITVTMLPPTVADAGPVVRNICSGLNATLGTAARANHAYQWTPAQHLSNPNAAQPVFNYVNTGTDTVVMKYYVQVTNNSFSKTCPGQDSIILKIAPVQKTQLSVAPNWCSGLPIIATGPTPPGSYTWTINGNVFSTQPTFNVALYNTGTTPLVHSLRLFYLGSGPNDCPVDTSFTITIEPELKSDLADSTAACAGSTITVGPTPQPGYTYSWTGPGITSTAGSQTTIQLGNLPALTPYIVRIGTSTGPCLRRDTIWVRTNRASLADAGPDQTTCIGSTLSLGGPSTAQVTVEWTPSTFLTNAGTCCPTFTASMAYDTVLTYALKVTDLASGCVSHDTAEITVRGRPRFTNNGPYTICSGQAATVGPDLITGYLYTWLSSDGIIGGNTGRTQVRIVNTTPDTLRRVFYFNAVAHQCLITDSVIVNVLPGIAQTVTRDNQRCEGAPAIAIPNTPLNGHSWQWSPAANLSSTSAASPTFTGTAPGIYIYYLTTTRLLDGCTRRDTVTITINRLPSLGLADRVLCANTATTIGVFSEPNTDYSWSPATYLNDASLASPVITVPNASSNILSLQYVLTATNRLSGCVVKDTLDVLVKPELTVNAGADQDICWNDSVLIGTPGLPGYSYSWLPATGLSSPGSAQTWVRKMAPGLHTFVLRAQSDNCDAFDTVRVNFRQPPVTLLRDFMDLCSGDTITVQNPAQAGYTYAWLNKEGLSDTALAQPRITLINTGTAEVVREYIVRITGTDGCFRQDTIGIIVRPLPRPAAGADALVCSGEVTTLGGPASTGSTYRWMPDTYLLNGTVANPTFTATNLSDTVTRLVYIVEETTVHGCKGYDTVLVNVKPLPRFNLPDFVVACSNQPVAIGVPTAIPGATYLWSNATGLSNAGSYNPTFQLATSRDTSYKYFLTATLNGCTFTDSVEIRLRAIPIVPVVAGRQAVCPGVQGSIYRVTNKAGGLNVQWRITGGFITANYGDSVQVAWGPANLNASIRAWFTRADVGCAGDSAILPIQIKKDIIAAKPIALQGDSLCLTDAGLTAYRTPAIPYSTFRWNLSGPGIFIGPNTGTQVLVRWQGAGTGRLWISETSTTPTDTCLGLSDTLKINILPIPDSTLAITGPAAVCENSGGHVYSLPTPAPGSTYSWQVVGGNASSIQGSSLTISWGSSGSGLITVRETNAAGCAGKLISLPVAIAPTPTATITQTDPLVCGSSVNGRVFQAASAQLGSIFHWNVLGGQIASANADSSRVVINWTAGFPSYYLSVAAYNPVLGCRGAEVLVPLQVDRPQTAILAVSTAEANASLLQVATSLSDTSALTPVFSLLRRPQGQSSWQPATRVTTRTGTFSDVTASTTRVWEYQVVGTDACGDTLRSAIHNNIVLNGQGNDEAATLSLNWNAYNGWPTGVSSYEIWRRMDGGSYALFESLNGSTTQFTPGREAGKDGFAHTYRIRATDGSQYAWSNEVELKFTNPIRPANVITANGDGRNDTWIIDNIALYPNHQVTISNRWGQQVYESNQYRNQWTGDQLPAGTYFYFIQVPDRNITLKGWLQLIR